MTEILFIFAPLIQMENYYTSYIKTVKSEEDLFVSNLISMRLFIIRNYLNVFLVEESSLKENCYRISHYNFSPTNYNIQKHYFNNTIKNNESLYKLNIDDMGNMIFTYDYSEQNKRSEVSTQTFVFNNSNRKWTPTHNLLRTCSTFSNFKSYSTIKDDIFEYCYSIIYKKN